MKKHWDNPIEHPMPAATRVPASMRIGNVTVAPATVLAPMAGVTDTVFRRFIRNASVFTSSSQTNLDDLEDQRREARPPVRPALRNASVFTSSSQTNLDDLEDQRREARPPVRPALRNASVFSSSSQTNLDDLEDQRREARPPVRPALGAPHLDSEMWDSASVEASVSRPSAPLLEEKWDSATVEAATTNESSGCGLIMTEFTSADGLSRMRESKRKRYLTFYDDEHPISAQLFGSNPATLADAARIVQDTGFDMVDLNLGCPAKRVVSCNGGSGLLRDLPLIQTIFESVRAAVTIPFTVKFRLGWNDNHIICVPLARLAEDCGLNAVALHARTREQGYSGQARWHHIAEVKDAVRIPVIGNGDVRSPEDACALIAQTGCDAVMIGRAAPANPWIFRQIAQYTATGRYDQPTADDRYRMIRTYFQMLVEESNPEAPGKMKQFASWFTHGVPGGAALRKSIYEARSGTAILDAVDNFFSREALAPSDSSVSSHVDNRLPAFVEN